MTLLMMANDGPNNDKAKLNFDLLCDVQILLGFVVILLLLQSIQNWLNLASCRLCSYVILQQHPKFAKVEFMFHI